LSRDQVSLQNRGGLDHRFSLLLDVDRRIFAGELAEFLRRGIEVLLDRLQALFEEYALAMRR